MSEEIFTAKDIAKTFHTKNGEVAALDSVSFDLRSGDFVAMHGPSGCGKSTLLLIAGALLSPDKGSVSIDGSDPYNMSVEERSAMRGEKIGFVFQQFHLIPYLDVLDNVLLGELASDSDLKERAIELLKEFQLEHRLDHTPSELSVGEQQRVALARALLRSPKLLLADEPTGNLDPENSEIILKHFVKFGENGGAVLMVTHDDQARQAANRSIQLQDGKIVSQ